IANFTLELTDRGECFQLLCSINRVRNQLTEKNFMITIQELFNDGEDILSSYPNITFLHTTFIFFRFIFLIIPADIAQKKCQPIRTDILTVFIKNSLCLPD